MPMSSLGRDGETLRMAIGLADALLVPTPPRAVDVWALRGIAGLVEAAQAAREDDALPPLRALAMLNMADPADTPDNRDARQALADFPLFQPMKAVLRRRRALANATAFGLAIGEVNSRDQKACEEVYDMLRIMFSYKDA